MSQEGVDEGGGKVVQRGFWLVKSGKDRGKSGDELIAVTVGVDC